VRRGPNSRVSRAKCLHSEDISDYILAPQRTSNLSHLNDSRKKPRVNLRLRNERDKETVAYFKALAADLGMPYQNIINLYLRDCAMSQRKLKLKWAAARVRPT